MFTRLGQHLRKSLKLAPFSEEYAVRITGRTRFSFALLRHAISSGDILDVGSSTGCLEYLAREQPNLHITGLELNDLSREIAIANLPGSAFVAGSATHLPFENESFDAVTMFEVLEHLKPGQELQAIREIRRVLRPGGTILLSTPFASLRARFLDPAWYFGHRHYSLGSLTRLVRDADMDFLTFEIKGGYGELCSMWLFYLYKWLLGAETPSRLSFENARATEFTSHFDGFTNIFIMARRPNFTASVTEQPST